MAHFAGFLIFFLLFSGKNVAQIYTSECEFMFEYFPYCLNFLTGWYYKPTRQCCEQVSVLNKLAKQEIGPQRICQCIEYIAKDMEPRLNASRVEELPMKCQTHLSFPISDSMDCSKV